MDGWCAMNLSSEQVCGIVGCTYRQLDYWCRRGVVCPSQDARGSGSQRLFSPHDVAMVRLAHRLRALGAPHEACRTAVAVVDTWPEQDVCGRVVVSLDGEVTRPYELDSDMAAGWLVDLEPAMAAA